jgi:RES domain-containing protein
MRIYRIADARHPLWEGTGAALLGARWNSPGRPVIYASLTHSCAMLEILVHANIGRLPATHAYVTVEVSDAVSVERHDSHSLPEGWDAESSAAARAFGDQWLDEMRSAILVVPSVVAKLEWNALVNPQHPDAMLLQPSTPQKVIWDQRLFGLTRS